jgi:rSAM/selenodomain-associated transferase 1
MCPKTASHFSVRCSWPDARPLLIIMLKEPVMGRVKTRLARETGWSEATRFARNAARSIIARLARDGRWRVLLAVAPDIAEGSRMWPARVARTRQGRGDLGARMARLLVAQRPALLIGADIPAVSPAVIADAFRLLPRNDVVLGPAGDGGYWLIGLNRMAPRHRLFRGVRWSGPHALGDTVASFGGARIGYAAVLGDVDDAESHRRWGALAGRITLLSR